MIGIGALKFQNEERKTWDKILRCVRHAHKEAAKILPRLECFHSREFSEVGFFSIIRIWLIIFLSCSLRGFLAMAPSSSSSGHGASKFLGDLPSRGFFSSTVPSSNPVMFLLLFFEILLFSMILCIFSHLYTFTLVKFHLVINYVQFNQSLWSEDMGILRLCVL